MSDNTALKNKILELVREYSRGQHVANRPSWDAQAAFVPGQTTIPYAGRVFDEAEVEAAVSATLDFWLTLGPEGDALETELADFLGARKTLLVNSGSSANLLAFSALTSPKLPAERRIQPGDEVITAAAGFPTTVAPIVQNGAVPVFLDNNPYTANADVSLLEEAYRPGKTKAVMMAHALGNPFDLAAVLAFCRKYDLWLVEDNCDALGCSYTLAEPALSLNRRHGAATTAEGATLTAPTGSFGDLSTQSFYPPHHLTMGEGGAVNIVNDMRLKTIVESLRDWGRDCWCPSGKDNTCGKRFGWELGELPPGYDHKYIYSHLGYNLKPLDPQAAIGRAQMRKLPQFVQARKQNWEILRAGLADLEAYIEFSLPTHATAWTPEGFLWDGTGNRTDCSWFGFQILIRPEAPFTHSELGQFLDARKIGTRMFFGGNLLRQPAFVRLRKERPEAVRVIGNLEGADRIMRSAIFLGVYPGLTRAMLDYMIESVHDFVRTKCGG